MALWRAQRASKRIRKWMSVSREDWVGIEFSGRPSLEALSLDAFRVTGHRRRACSMVSAFMQRGKELGLAQMAWSVGSALL